MKKALHYLLPSLLILVLTLALVPAQFTTSAAVSELFFSEYIEGTSNNKALEIYNGTGSPVDLAAGGYNVQMYFNGSASAGLTINLTGVVATGDVFVLAHSSAAAAILAQADQTNGAGWFNGNDAVVLRRGSTILDVIGQIGFNPGTEWGTGLTSTADNTLRRAAAVCEGDNDGTDVFDPSPDWIGFATDTFDGLGAHSAECNGGSTIEPKLNEFSASTAGTDIEYVEIFGAPNTDYSYLTILEIEGDAGASAGMVDEVIGVGTTDNSGFWLASLPANALENGTITLLLVSNFTGALGNDLDIDNDGVFDITPWDAVVDSVAVNDGGTGDRTYGGPVLTVMYDGLSFTPGGASRIPDGYDTDLATDWVRNDFDLAGIPGFPGTIGPGEAYNTPGTPNEIYVAPPADVCADPFTSIYTIQGTGTASPLAGQNVTTRGVVTGDFQGTGELNGFFLQDASGDGNNHTSDGIFVFVPLANPFSNVDVSVGDTVGLTGRAIEFNTLTEIDNVTALTVCGSGTPLEPVAISLPETANGDLERYEGMLVTFEQTLTVSQNYFQGRYGQVTLSSDGRLYNHTNVYLPGTAEAEALRDENARRLLVLDDGRSSQNPNPIPYIGDGNTLRAGDAVTGVTGVLDFGLITSDSSTRDYRLHPTTPPVFTRVNERTALPDPVGGTVKVASFNVLNYFNGDGMGGGFPTSRGANTLAEFNRQRAKIIAALTAIDADVVGLMEIEKDGFDATSAIQDLVNGLNAATAPGTYAFVTAPAPGTDEIMVALIYKPAAVTPTGAAQNYQVSDPVYGTALYDRPPLGQTFERNENGARFSVVVNHFKSKGSCPTGGLDADQGDGQGCWNAKRVRQAEELLHFAGQLQVVSGDPDVLIIGDLNAYGKEDPITALTSQGLTNEIERFTGVFAYSYIFDGLAGYLDHALSTASLSTQVVGVTEWHINTDEPSVIDYNTEFKPQDLYAPTPYRSSDHDPVIVGLELSAAPTVSAGGPYTVAERGQVLMTAEGSDPEGEALSYAWDLDNDGIFETPGQSATFMAGSLDGPGSATIWVKATDSAGQIALASATVNITNADPTAASSSASQSVQYSDPIAPVTVTGEDVPGDIPLIAGVQWKSGAGGFTSGLPAGTAFDPAGCGSNSCTWTLSGKALAAPGIYTIRVTLSDKDGGSAWTDIALTVLAEDARATYTGALFAATSSASSSKAQVVLAATVQDITAADPVSDPFPGDITNATVTFIDRDNGSAVLCSAVVGFVNLGDPTTGTATCTWQVELGNSDSTSARVGIVVGGYYSRNDPSEDSLVTVSRALTSNFITGGGSLLMSDSSGQLPGDPGSRNSFGLHVKYNKSGKNLQGRINTLITSGGRVYQIKGNVLSSLVVQPAPCENASPGAPCTAVFSGRASIQDVSDPENPVEVDGNATIQVTMTDYGEPGSSDSLAITVWNKNGGLWFASRWDGVQTVEQVLAGGNLVIH